MNPKYISCITLFLALLFYTHNLNAQTLEVEGDVVAYNLTSPLTHIGSLKGDSLTTNDALIGALHANKSIMVGTDGVEVDGNFTTSGWTQLGDSTDTNFPVFKIKRLTGFTTSSSGNLIAVLPHGLDSNKFISVSPLVFYNATNENAICENYNYNTGYEFHLSWDTTNISISREANNSFNILNKPIVITIMYVE